MKPKEMWNLFAEPEHLEKVPWTADSFGASPEEADELAALVLEGKKTATCSAYELYAYTNETMYAVGDYTVVTDSTGEAVCIIRTEKLSVVPFGEVSAAFAYKEGEGDRTLEYWRRVHRVFFEKEFRGTPLTLTDTTPLLCEEFQMVFCL